MGKLLKKRHRWLGAITCLIFLSASLSFLALWHSQNVQVLSVQSASMVPMLHPGDAVITKKVNLDAVSIGNVISYHDPLQPAVIITHRVIFVDRPRHLITTKGDNAPVADEPFDASLVIGRVSYGLNKVGYALNFLRSPAGLILVVYLPAALIVWQELRRLGKEYSRPTYRLVWH